MIHSKKLTITTIFPLQSDPCYFIFFGWKVTRIFHESGDAVISLNDVRNGDTLLMHAAAKGVCVCIYYIYIYVYIYIIYIHMCIYVYLYIHIYLYYF